MQEITCSRCGTVFHRQPQRGRKPTQCDGCRSGSNAATASSAFAPPLPGQLPLAVAPPVFDFSDVFKPASAEPSTLVMVAWGPGPDPGHRFNPVESGFTPVKPSVLAQPGPLPKVHYRIAYNGGVMFYPGVFATETEARNKCNEVNASEDSEVYAVAKIEILS